MKRHTWSTFDKMTWAGPSDHTDDYHLAPPWAAASAAAPAAKGFVTECHKDN